MIINMTGGGKPELQVKTVTPSTSNVVVTPDSGYDGLSQVTVNGDPELVAGNIKEGVNIFGITGTYTGPDTELLAISGFGFRCSVTSRTESSTAKYYAYPGQLYYITGNNPKALSSVSVGESSSGTSYDLGGNSSGLFDYGNLITNMLRLWANPNRTLTVTIRGSVYAGGYNPGTLMGRASPGTQTITATISPSGDVTYTEPGTRVSSTASSAYDDYLWIIPTEITVA